MSRVPANENLEPDMDSENDESQQMNAERALPAGPSEEEFAKLREERDSLFERFARAQADFQNSRKRLETDAENRLQYANATLIKSILPVIDNLDRAISVDAEKADAKSILKGLRVLFDQFTKVLSQQHVELIEPQPGTPFDPTKHEALMQETSDEYDPNTVTKLLQRGYALHDRTLRPAQVAVSKAG